MQHQGRTERLQVVTMEAALVAAADESCCTMDGETCGCTISRNQLVQKLTKLSCTVVQSLHSACSQDNDYMRSRGFLGRNLRGGDGSSWSEVAEWGPFSLVGAYPGRGPAL